MAESVELRRPGMNARWKTVLKQVVMAVVLTLWASGAWAELPKDFKKEWIPSVAVPRMTRAPVIDGTIDPVEWREAAAISGIGDVGNNILIPRPVMFCLAWDSGHLYLAVRTYLGAGYKPAIHSGRADGLAYTFDDGLEFVWKPMGRNVVDRRAAFKFFVNCIGNKGDTSRLTLGQMFKDWDPKFKTAWRITEPGSAPNGGSWWELEMSCTPEDFELKGENRVGDEWRLMLGFNHIPGWTQARIPCLGSYFDDSGGGYPRATLVENTPGVQFVMDSLNNLATDGTAAMTVKAFNPTKEEAKVEVSVDVAGTIVKTETLTVPAGGEASFKLADKLPANVVDGVAHVNATMGGKPLLSYTAFFKVGYRPEMLAAVQPPDPNKFGFRVDFSPVRRLLMLAGDTWFFEKPEDAAGLAWKVYPEGTPGKEIAAGKIDKAVLWRLQDLVTLPELKPGKYTVEGAITMKDGKVRGPMTATIEKKDEAKEYPQWWGKTFGSPDQVIPPFTAIKTQRTEDRGQKSEMLSCWGREYSLSALGLPQAIQSQGRPVTAAPGRLVVKAGGKETVVLLAPATITDAKDWRVRFKGTSTGAGLSFSAEGWLEQDGLVYVELTYGPEGREPVAVEALRLEYPLADEDADGLVCIGPGGNFSSMTAMLLPRDKSGSLWSTLVTGKPGSRMAKGNFYPTVWVGSERRGFVWWADSDRGWFPEDDIPAHEVLRTGASGQTPGAGEVVFRNNIVGKPVTLADKRTIAFSYMATPFRPFTKGWRAVNATDDGTFFVPHRSVRRDSKTGKMVNEGAQQMNWIHPESRYPEEWDALWSEQKTGKQTAYGPSADACVRAQQWFSPYGARSGVSWQHMSFTLSGWGPKTIQDDLMNYFCRGGRWDCEFDQSFLDYAMYLFDGAFGKGGVVQTYWDITFPNEIGNPVSGQCYLLPNGQTQNGYVGWNSRRFFQRLQALMAQYKLVPNGNGGHSTQAYLTVAMPWMDAVLDGELSFNLDVSDRDWVDYYPIARMRSMSSPHNWGVPICWMGHLFSEDKAKETLARIERQEYLWMHDSWFNPYAAAEPNGAGMPDTILDFGLNGDATAYHPYWRNPYVACDNKDLLISLWRLADKDGTGMVAEPVTGRVDRVLLGVFNYNRKDTQNITLKVDLKALGLDAPGTEVVARELYGPENGGASYFKGHSGSYSVPGLFGMECRLDAATGTLSLPPLAPHRARYIGLRLEKEQDAGRLFAALKAVAAKAGAPAPVAVPEAILNWGAAEPGATFHEFGNAPHVASANAAVHTAAWVLPDRVLLAVANTGDKRVDAALIVDLDKLNLTPRLPWQEFIRVRDFSSDMLANNRPPTELDFHARTLKVNVLEPRTVRLIGIRRY